METPPWVSLVKKKKKINKNAKCTSKTNTSSGLLSSYCNLKCAILKQLIV